MVNVHTQLAINPSTLPNEELGRKTGIEALDNSGLGPVLTANELLKLPSKYSMEGPSVEEVEAEWYRFHLFRNSGKLEPQLPENQWIAYFDDKVIDCDPDHMTLVDRVSIDLKVHPDRFVITYNEIYHFIPT